MSTITKRWPWSRKAARQHLVLSWSEGTLAYLRLQSDDAGAQQLLSCGVERQGSSDWPDFVRRLQALNLNRLAAQIMLRPSQYQMLEIDRPAVADSELRFAVRYQLQGLQQPVAAGSAEALTLDVMPVGLLAGGEGGDSDAIADRSRSGPARLFVVAAAQPSLQAVLQLADAMHWTVSVIDIQETAQRNLQAALADPVPASEAQTAQASLLLIPGQPAVLTISAGQALFYTRRLELPEGFLADLWFVDGQSTASFVDAETTPASTSDPAADPAAVGDYLGQQHQQKEAQASAGFFNPQAQNGRELLLQLQRSLDLWERSRSGRRLSQLQVFAGSYSQPCAVWLSARLGRQILPLNAAGLLPGFSPGTGPEANQQALCLPLLGALLRQSS